ncbi:MAG: PQQ-binding-like beta-propeller repeat protein [Acidobacteria bacterium]|nr:PQQ-binding-like beta-propeller repeat protein [Acidobacteriota bacterium]
MPNRIFTSLLVFLVCLPLGVDSQTQTKSPVGASTSDWTEWRGPARNGTSSATGLPEKWSPKGENLVWKQPFGGRSAPIIMGNRVFVFNSAGEGETMQERLMCFAADTGKLLWEHRTNVYSSDVPPRRIAWSAPAGDTETGNVYTFGACNELMAWSYEGKFLWSRSLTDEFGAWTTQGGRTTSPIIEGDNVIVSTIIDGWGDTALRRHRFYAFDKRTGECVWVSTPGERPYDTVYPTPIAATINGTRLLIVGGADGAVHAIKAATGEPVWNFLITKRGINNCAVVKGNTVFASHSEENYETNEMGMLTAIDATGKGKLTKSSVKWSLTGFRGGYSSPVLDGDRLYQLDDSANLFAFDINTGKELWKHTLGTLQKASPVFGDGKLYVGTENGKFFILKPSATGCQVLDEEQLESIDNVQLTNAEGDDLITSNEQIIASAAIAHGQVFLVSTKNIYCIGKKGKVPAFHPTAKTLDAAPADAPVAHLQVIPADVIMQTGESAKFKLRLFDDHGRFIREASSATWTLDGLQGNAQGNQFTPAASAGAQGGNLQATVAGVNGIAHVRVVPPLPLSEDFSRTPLDAAPKYWINATGKYGVREVEGNKILVKKTEPVAFKRTRSLIGPTHLSNYTIEADVRAVAKRRQLGDAGVVAQRYSLILFGNSQRLELQSWQIEPKRNQKVPFAWTADKWYHLKLEVQNLPNGKTRVRGKAWATDEAEPTMWTIERMDSIPNKHGSPGIFADAPAEVFFDNIKVVANQ